MRKKTNAEFVRQVQDLVGDSYIPLTKYKNKRTKVLMFHADCCKNYWVSPDSFVNGGRRCHYCYGNNKVTLSRFKQEVKEMYGKEYTVTGTKYRGRNKPIEIRHNICNHKFHPTPHSLLAGHTCYYCSYIARANNKAKTLFIKNKLSKGEKLTKEVLSDLKCNYDFGYVLPNRLHLDFYIPSINLGIEYDGIQHFEPRKLFGGEKQFKKQKKLDYNKNQYCKDHHIKLIRIPYTVNTKEGIKKILSPYINQ